MSNNIVQGNSVSSTGLYATGSSAKMISNGGSYTSHATCICLNNNCLLTLIGGALRRGCHSMTGSTLLIAGANFAVNEPYPADSDVINILCENTGTIVRCSAVQFQLCHMLSRTLSA